MAKAETKLAEDRGLNKKTCFLITPIDSIDSDTRRHIDGLIDEVIIPVLDELDFETDSIVAHRDYTAGQIVKGIIEKVYESDLVIANLTKLNPNVMYELAFRHALGKATVIIAEYGTKLPFDTNNQRTIFYHNDFKGAFQLKEDLRNTIKCINFEQDIFDNPIISSIKTINVEKNLKTEGSTNDLKAFDYIINRLDVIENKLQYKNNSKNAPRSVRELSLGLREDVILAEAEFLFMKIRIEEEIVEWDNDEIRNLVLSLTQKGYILSYRAIKEKEKLILKATIDKTRIESIIEYFKLNEHRIYQFIDYRIY